VKRDCRQCRVGGRRRAPGAFFTGLAGVGTAVAGATGGGSPGSDPRRVRPPLRKRLGTVQQRGLGRAENQAAIGVQALDVLRPEGAGRLQPTAPR